MESHPIVYDQIAHKPREDFVQSFKNIVEVDNKITINIEPNIFNFTQEKHKIEATLRQKSCAISG